MSIATGDKVVLLYGVPQSSDPAGWTKDEPDQYHMTLDDSIKVPNPETRTDYQFAGWDVSDVSGTVTFAAQWLKTEVTVPNGMSDKITEVGSGLLDYAKAKLTELNAAVLPGDTKRIQELDVVMTVEAYTTEQVESSNADQSLKSIVGIAEGRTLIAYDIVINSTVTTRTWDGTAWTVATEAQQPVTDTGSPLAIRVPFDYSGKTDVKVYRYHGAPGVFDSTPNSLGEYSEEVRSANAIDIHAQLFSTYAIGYRASSGAASGTPVTEPKPVTPDKSGVADWLITDDHVVYIVGYPDGEVKPLNQITRAETAMIFYRLLKDQSCANPDLFSDVQDGKWYTEAVRTLAAKGIILGYPDRTFAPDKAITRAEFTTIALRFAKDIKGMGAFSDVGTDHWANEAIASAAAYQWITGYPDGSFRPNQTITRAEVSAIVNRMLGRSADREFVAAHFAQLKQFSDLQDNRQWYFYHLVEATNAHDFIIHSDKEMWK